MAGIFKLLQAIAYKIYIHRRRHFVLTLIELLFPIFCCGLFYFGNTKVQETETPGYKSGIIKYPVSRPDFSNETYYEACASSPRLIWYAPINEFTENIMKKVDQAFKISAKGVDNEASVSKELRSNHDNREYPNFGVIFKTTQEDEKGFRYKILTTFLITSGKLSEVPYEGEMDNLCRRFIRRCFILLQMTLDSAFIETVSGKVLPYKVHAQEMPYPESHVTYNYLLNVLLFFLSLVITVTIISVIIGIVDEKKSGSKELMKINEMTSSMIWFGWVLYANLAIIFDCILVTIVLKLKPANAIPILPRTDTLLIFLISFLYFNSIISFVFFCSTWFTNVLVACGVTLLIHLATENLAVKLEEPSTIVTYLECFIPNGALNVAIGIITQKESLNLDGNWNELFRTVTIKPISLGFVLIMFVVNIVIYGLLTFYVDALRPGPYGVAKKWNFCCPSFRKKKELESLSRSSTFFQETITDFEVGLGIRNLSKVYPDVVAVKHVNLDIYGGEITVLLGHNGAGKTTLMSMITGMCSPTSGEIYRYTAEDDYYNIFDNMKKFRQSLGLCPQENLHFTYFTVIEHLIFFGIMKGLSVSEARRNGDNLLQLMGMKAKRKSVVSKLSGGMMRKLSLAIALVGVPEILILDEPTSGMDPESRREIWDVLLEVRENRIIIITTHYMEEADILADRIAIMEHGSIFCHGTSMFLKNVFGAGYYLQLMVKKGTNVNSLTNVITGIIPGSNLIQSSDEQIKYILPLEWKSKFSQLFSELEDRGSNDIQSIGVSFTTLEEVFLKVDQIAALKKKKKEERDDVSVKTEDITEQDMEEVQIARELSEEYQWASMIRKLGGHQTDTGTEESASLIIHRGLPLIMIHFCALLWKKLLYTLRTIFMTLILGLLAVLMAFFAIILMDLVTVGKTDEIIMSSDMYKGSSIVVHYTQSSSEYFNIYKSLIHGSSIETIKDKSITEALLRIGEKDLIDYRLKYLLAADWRDDSAIALYSRLTENGPIISINLITNTILKHYHDDKSITISAAQVASDQSCMNYLTNANTGLFYWLIFIPLGSLFAVSNCISYPSEERICGAKHLQLMTGLSPIIYWGTAYIVDVTIYTFFMLLMTVPIFVVEAIRNVYIYSNPKEIGIFFVIVELFGICCIPFGYFFSFFNKSFGKATTNIFILHMLIGILGIGVLVLRWVQKQDEGLWNVLFYLLQLFPTYPLTIALLTHGMIISLHGYCTICKRLGESNLPECTGEEMSFFVFEGPKTWGLNNYLIALIIDGIIFSILVLLTDYGLIGCIYHTIHKIWLGKPSDDDNLDDDDVLQEKSKVNEAVEHSDIAISYSLIVDGLVKKYTRKFTAVNDVSFLLTKGECFGLLGVNGAGKSTTFKILTGTVRPLSGNAHINEYSLSHNKNKYLQNIGYCPQAEAFNKILTGRQMIKLFGQLRGLSDDSLNEITNFWITVLGLTEYQDRQCRTYSGGNKRKVSVAMALIGRPEVIFLDEPTSGVDPVSRRKLWTVLQYCQKFGQSIVLTSHSMDECEILCNRITIMVHGQMKCIGFVQHLKSKFSQGFTIIIKLVLLEDYDNKVQTIKNEMEEQFRDYCVLKDEHKGQLNYHITNVQEKWSNLFGKMENMKNEFEIIEDYTISETTLEELFLSFARE